MYAHGLLVWDHLKFYPVMLVIFFQIDPKNLYEPKNSLYKKPLFLWESARGPASFLLGNNADPVALFLGKGDWSHGQNPSTFERWIGGAKPKLNTIIK